MPSNNVTFIVRAATALGALLCAAACAPALEPRDAGSDAGATRADDRAAPPRDDGARPPIDAPPPDVPAARQDDAGVPIDAPADAARDAAPPDAPTLVTHWLGEDGNRATEFASLTGARVRVHLTFSNWVDDAVRQFSFTASHITEDRAAGAVTMMTWGPNDTCPNILSGTHDAYLHEWARAAAADGRPFMLRMAHEANGFWYPWSYGGDGPSSTAAQFAAMWRHVHDIFVAEGARNVRWVWCPNTATGGGIVDFTPAYPGDAYVDYVGLDGYNFGTSRPGGRWHSFTDEFQHSYDLVMALTRRPLLVCETATSEDGGDKAAWITSAFTTEIPRTMPNIAGVIWFNENKETDWRVNSSPAALAAYRAVAADPRWQAALAGFFP